MKTGLRQRMSWLHTWCGLVCAWLLCLIFLAGSISVFRAPISRWMTAEPALPPAVAQADPATVLGAACGFLAQQDAKARFWRIELPSEAGQAMRLVWRTAANVTHEAAMDPRDGALLPQPWGRKTEGGRHFMTLHYTLYGGTFGFWLVGWLTMGMLVALLTGIVVHKRIFKDFFTFRPGRGQRAWLDGHNASAVLTLPFQLMIAFTGLAIFYTSYLPGPLRAAYGENGYGRWQTELAEAAGASGAAALPPPPSVAGDQPVRQQLAVLLSAAQAALGSPARMIMVERPGQNTERITVYARSDEAAMLRQLHVPTGRAVFNATTGEFTALHLPVAQASADPAHTVLESLHLAAFGGWTIRWLYFFCGMAGALMMATGAILFTIKRRNKAEGEFGARTALFYRLVEAVNVAAIAGACLACVAYFHANRWIDAGLADRATWEIRAFFLVWLLSLIHAFWRPVQRAWVEQMAAAAVLCLSLPLSNVLTTGQHGVAYAQAGDWTLALVEVSVVLTGCVLALISWRLRDGVWAAPRPGRLIVLPQGYRWRVLARVLSAVVGGYFLATVMAVLLTQALAASVAGSRAMAVATSTLLAFVLYALLAMWVFASVRAWRYLLGLLAVLAPLAYWVAA